ncbi:MAG: deoxyribodipyrimidine photo-lyase [Haliscomenobacter sp.]|nr:deoxyribodipyrimidine photo-lyase [Haliscomenobacter sp.]
MGLSIFWFRRDLRLSDNRGLYEALQGPNPVLPLFIFDTDILNALPSRQDARVVFIYRELERLQKELEVAGSGLYVAYGKPKEVWKALFDTFPITSVYTNRDYEPYALQRDLEVMEFLGSKGIPFHAFKDHVIFEELEVAKGDGSPYTVFTPYSKAWKERAQKDITAFAHYPSESLARRFFPTPPFPMPSWETLGFQPGAFTFPDRVVSEKRIRAYGETRDFPSMEEGTSRLGIHFRFGTLSIREKARKAWSLNDTYLNELIWRDFYSMILANFPRVEKRAFRPEYDSIDWLNNEQDFEKWKTGTTGYPLVDAGMRQLNATGYMHNRVRMVVASFLSKHLLIDWRWGEPYFAEKLLDFDLASNNGGWQWAAGCGTDAAPYFRIFNPTAQQAKFDSNEIYIRKWIPEFGTPAYPPPMVEHGFARSRCLEAYKAGIELGKKKFSGTR